jgi:hypothetical protein
VLETGEIKLEKKMALFSQRQLGLGAPDCPVVHRTVSGVPGWRLSTGCSRVSSAAYDYKSPDCPVVHRTVRWANSRPGQRSAAESARDAWQSQRSEGGTGLSGVHRTVSDAPTALNLQRSASPNKERDPHRTVRCARRQKARIAFLKCSQRLLAALGL